MVSCSGPLVSPAAGRAGCCRQISLCGGSSHSVPATLGLPLLMSVCALPVYAAQVPGCPIGSGPCVAWVPVFGYSTKARTRLRLRFVPSPAQAAQAARSLTGALSPGAARLLPSAAPASVSACAHGVPAPCVCSRELASSRDPPSGCRPSRISGSLWLEPGSLFAAW